VQEQSVQQIMLAQAGIDISRCPCCKAGTMRKIYEIPQGAGESSFCIIRPASARSEAEP
jgi:hypothetical protein